MDVCIFETMLILRAQAGENKHPTNVKALCGLDQQQQTSKANANAKQDRHVVVLW